MTWAKLEKADVFTIREHLLIGAFFSQSCSRQRPSTNAHGSSFLLDGAGREEERHHIVVP